mmetsp:Transcript_59972/g.126980  ORF Transcript_59972/g.126980 Transcript_59972/m.126980 type:complete len:253 (+) Transcript_59972:1736-2494(+)
MQLRPNRHLLLERRVVPVLTFVESGPPLHGDIHRLWDVELDHGGLRNLGNTFQELTLNTSCIAHQGQPKARIYSGEDVWELLIEKVREDRAIADSCRVGSASIDAEPLLKVVQESLDEGQVIHASRPTARTALVLEATRRITRRLRRHNVLDTIRAVDVVRASPSSCDGVLIVQAGLAVPIRSRVPTRSKVNDVFARHPCSLTVCFRVKRRWINHEVIVLIRAGPHSRPIPETIFWKVVGHLLAVEPEQQGD